MPLTVPAESEALLYAEAKRTGVPPEVLLSRAVIASLSSSGFYNDTEADLVRRATETLSDDFWNRYRELVKMRDEERLTEVDRGEYIALVRLSNEWNNRRLEAGIALSKKRGVPYEQVKEELQIQPVNAEVE